ncbi:unnamed protein product [Absidia cylindrospora]
MRVLPLLLAGLAVLVSGDVAKAPVTELQIDVEHQVPEELCTQKSRDGDKLYMHYTGTLYDTGAKFDSSVDRNQPFSFVLGAGRVIQGWELGLKNMCIGEKRRLTIPSKMAYGDRGVRVIPGGATLVFDVELLDIKSNRRVFDKTGNPTEQPFTTDNLHSKYKGDRGRVEGRYIYIYIYILFVYITDQILSS